MLREFGFTTTLPIKKERQQSTRLQQANKQKITSNSYLMQRAKDVNSYDLKLYQLAKEKFCKTLNKYEDLKAKLSETKLTCD